MKKLLVILLATLLVFALATAEEPVMPEFQWQRDAQNHWQGSPADAQAHSLDDNWICSICGCEVLAWDDGSADLYDYDEYGNPTRYTCINSDGAIILEIVHALTYENGVLVRDHEFYDGVFLCETIYAGDHIPVKQTVWNDDGSTSINEYDENGNCVHAYILDADGMMSFETISEFTETEDGWYTEVKTTSRFADGTCFQSEYNLFGDPIRTVNTEADGTIWSDTVYEYEYDGINKVWCKQYSFGRLAMESWYQDGQLITETEYPEEGGKYIYEYNDNGDITLITSYAADGTLLSIESFEYDEEEWNWFDED
ncbi:MAG: hypothetical protein E7318_03870 [Clostridiales bacterium]|nr:hypothetical protein [Clostridiales bacterium]